MPASRTVRSTRVAARACRLVGTALIGFALLLGSLLVLPQGAFEWVADRWIGSTSEWTGVEIFVYGIVSLVFGVSLVLVGYLLRALGRRRASSGT